MKTRFVAIALIAALAVAGLGYVSDWWHLRSGTAVPAGTGDGYTSVVVVVGPDVDKSALAEVKTLEDLKKVPGLRFDTTGPTPSAHSVP